MKRKLKRSRIIEPKKKTKKSDGTTRVSGYYGRFGFVDQGPRTVVEKKYFDTVKDSASITGGGTVMNNSLLLIGAGTGATQRVGRMIKLKSIHLRGHVVSNLATASDYYRIVVYLDQQANGAAATLTDIFANGSGGSAPQITSYLNLQNSRRFKILRDMRMESQATLYNSAATNFGQDIKHFDANISCDLTIEYGTNGSAITDLKSNNVGIVVFSFHTSNLSTISYVARVRFTDI